MTVVPYLLAGGVALLLGTRKRRITSIVPARINWMPNNIHDPVKMRIRSRYWFTVPVLAHTNPSDVLAHPEGALELNAKIHEMRAGRYLEVKIRPTRSGVGSISIGADKMHVEVKS